MQRLRLGILLPLIKQAHASPAFSPLPGLWQLGPPTLCALHTALPAALHEPALCTSLISLRSFAAAAEPCRIEDQQSAAEALFKVDDQTSEVHSHAPAVYPFFARAYYVGEPKRVVSKPLTSFMLVHLLTSACCRQLYQPGTVDKACQQTRLSYLCRQRHGVGMCCCRHKGQAVRECLRNGQLCKPAQWHGCIYCISALHSSIHNTGHKHGSRYIFTAIHTVGTSARDVCGCLQIWLCCHLQWPGARERGAQALSGILH